MMNFLYLLIGLISFILFVGISLPRPPGILGMYLAYKFPTKEEKRKRESIKKIKELEEILKSEGKDLGDELMLARKGQSKYLKESK